MLLLLMLMILIVIPLFAPASAPGAAIASAHAAAPAADDAAPGAALLRLWFYHRVVACRLLCSISGAEFARAEFAHELTAFAARVLSSLCVCSRRL